MQLFDYLKGVIAAVGATVFPPIFNWLVTLIPGNPPQDVQIAISMLLTAIACGGAVVVTKNKNQVALPPNTVVVDKDEAVAGAAIVAAHKG